MRIARDGSDAPEAEIERCCGKARAGEEGYQEGAETTVHVEGEAPAVRKEGEGRYVIDDAVREIGGGADKEDSVAVD